MNKLRVLFYKKEKNMNKKRILSAILMSVLVLSISITSFAANNNSYGYDYSSRYSYYEELYDLFRFLFNKMDASLTANEVTSNDHRHIKLEWESIKCANGYNIQISTDEKFENLVVDRMKPSNSMISNQSYSTSISDVSNRTLYIRIRPVCDKKFNDKYYRMYGMWSNTIIAEIHK